MQDKGLRLSSLRSVQAGDMGNTMSWREAKWFGRPWQDVIFSFGEIAFLIALVPLLFRANVEVGAFTGLLSAFWLYTFVVAHVSYRNWITVGLTTLAATLWVLIGLGVHL